jgi:PLP dependent protein
VQVGGVIFDAKGEQLRNVHWQHTLNNSILFYIAIMTTLKATLAQVHQQIEDSCKSSDRNPASVSLLAVSKTFTASAILEAAAAGQRDFGENYIQEALGKISELAAETRRLGLRWHCIGPVQSNKTRDVAAHFDWVHTVDRLKIAQRLSEQRPGHLPPLQICLQVNTDGGANKSGLAPAEVGLLAKQVVALPRLCLRGLMAIPEPQPDHASAYAVHLRLRHLLTELQEQGLALDTLSMGMSADLKPAIAAGSTIVRVGTAIFGKR